MKKYLSLLIFTLLTSCCPDEDITSPNPFDLKVDISQKDSSVVVKKIEKNLAVKNK